MHSLRLGAPLLDETFLQAAPRLKAIFYGAGSIRDFTTEAFWKRGIIITSAYAANAIPVAEFTLAQIILTLKRAWFYARELPRLRSYRTDQQPPGTYERTVALISLGMIGKLVREKLRSLDCRIIAYDPFITQAQAKELDVELVSLEESFARADVVSTTHPISKKPLG